MANNIIVKNAGGANVTVRTTETANVHVTHHNAFILDANDADAMGTVTGTPAANSVLGRIKNVSDSITTYTGSLTETAPASDTASSGLNGRLQRIAQRITSLIALIPTSLGSKSAANSFAVTLSTENAQSLANIEAVLSTTALANNQETMSTQLGNVLLKLDTMNAHLTDIEAAAEDLTTPNPVEGSVASGAAFTSKPMGVAGLAKTDLPTAESDGDLVRILLSKFGEVIAKPTLREKLNRQMTLITASTSETTIVTAAASTYHDLIALVIANTSGTDTDVDIRDTTGGSILFTISVKAGQTAGFAIPGVPIPQATVNTNWTAQCADSISSIRVFALYQKTT